MNDDLAMCVCVCPEQRRYCSLRTSAIGLKFDEVAHSTMKQISILNGHARPIFAYSMNLYNFPW